MAEHRKHDEKAAQLRREISSKLNFLLEEDGMNAGDLADRYKAMNFKTHAQAHGIICGFKRGGISSRSMSTDTPMSFSNVDLKHLSQIFFQLNIDKTDPLIDNVKKYDNRFIYPPETTPQQREVRDYSI